MLGWLSGAGEGVVLAGRAVAKFCNVLQSVVSDYLYVSQHGSVIH